MTKKLQRQMFARSLLLQSCWNYERMQNLGFAMSLDPYLRKLYRKEDPALASARARHLEFFNTQPYMASFVLGVVARLEEDLAQSSRDATARINSLKSAMGSALAAMGDKFFWGTLRPLGASIAFIVWLAARTWNDSWAWITTAGILAFLILINVPALWIRWNGIGFGYLWGEAIAEELKKFHWQKHIHHLRQVGVGISAALAILVIFAPPFETKTIFIRAGGLAGCFVIKIFRFSVLRAYGVILAVGLLAAFGGWIL